MEDQLDLFAPHPAHADDEDTVEALPLAEREQQIAILRWAAALGDRYQWTRGEWAIRVESGKYVPCEVMDDEACLWCPLASLWVTTWRLGYGDDTLAALTEALAQELRIRHPKGAQCLDAIEDPDDAIVEWIEGLPFGSWGQTVSGLMRDAADVMESGRRTPWELEALRLRYDAWHQAAKWVSAGLSIREMRPAQDWIMNCADYGGHGWHLFEDCAALRPFRCDEHRAEQILKALADRGWIVRARHHFPVRQHAPASITNIRRYLKDVEHASACDFAYGPSERLNALYEADPAAVIPAVLADLIQETAFDVASSST